MIRHTRILHCMLVWSCLLSILASVSAMGGMLSTTEEGREFLDANEKKEGIISMSETGLQYKVINTGTGTNHPTEGSEIIVHYEGRLIDGEIFDSTFGNKPGTFELAGVINGWKEILPKMVEGDKFEVYIPAELAYGANGSPPKIGPGEVLIFVMELVEVRGHSSSALYCKALMPSSPTEDYRSIGCNEQETEYILMASQWDNNKLFSEQHRLATIGKDKMKRESKHWVNRRFHILKQLRNKKFDVSHEL